MCMQRANKRGQPGSETKSDGEDGYVGAEEEEAAAAERMVVRKGGREWSLYRADGEVIQSSQSRLVSS